MNFKLFKRPVKPGTRRDYRVVAVVAAIVGTALLGYGVSLLPERGVSAVTQAALPPASRADLSDLPKASADQQRPSSASLESQPVPASPSASGTKKALAPKEPEATGPAKILQTATAHIDAKRFDAAITSLNDARAQVQGDPQSYLLMARALEGKADYDTARDFYSAAIDRNSTLADAYFGFATTSEKMGDLEAAIGGMRNFLHVQPNADPQKLQIVQARSAIWEWESKLGRGAWGPTKGIPPGFSEAELKRDGRGVGVKMPLEETKQGDGSMKYEIKAQDKFKLFKP
jgi:tetratricopeptide (TPR) repeat protein